MIDHPYSAYLKLPHNYPCRPFTHYFQQLTYLVVETKEDDMAKPKKKRSGWGQTFLDVGGEILGTVATGAAEWADSGVDVAGELMGGSGKDSRAFKKAVQQLANSQKKRR